MREDGGRDEDQNVQCSKSVVVTRFQCEPIISFSNKRLMLRFAAFCFARKINFRLPRPRLA
jgi:hypothetical protein